MRTTAAQKDAALRRAAMSLDEFVYAMNEARFKPANDTNTDIFKIAEQRLYGKLDKKGSLALTNISANGNSEKLGGIIVDPNAVNQPSGNNGNSNQNASEKNRPPSPKTKKKPSASDGLLAALNLDSGSDHKLKRLHDILKPYMIEGGVDVSYFSI